MPTYNQIIDFLASYGFTLHNISPLIVLSIVLYFFISRSIKSHINVTKNRVKNIEHCVIEMSTILKSKFPKLTLSHAISDYGQANSPIILRPEFKPFVVHSKLELQIKDKESTLLKWLKSEKPKTGLDAQDDIENFVVTDKVSKYLDLTEFKQYLYNKGKTSRDAVGILTVYLFEFLIPKLNLPDGGKKA